MIKIIGISVATLFCTLILKDKNRVFSIIISVAGICILIGVAGSQLSEVINGIVDISRQFNSSLPYIKTMLKVLGITLSTQIISDICSDNGENALASVTQLTAKIMIISLLVPLFQTIISVVNGLVK